MMNTTLIRNLALFFGLVATSFIAAPVSACSCVRPKTAKAGLKISDSVFVGKVVAIKHVKFFKRVRVDFGGEKSKIVTASEEYYQLKLIVSRSWKGAPRRTTFVLTDYGTSCERKYAKGQAYLVYAYSDRKPKFKEDTGLHTHMCTRTAKVSDAKKDLAELGKGKVPLG